MEKVHQVNQLRHFCWVSIFTSLYSKVVLYIVGQQKKLLENRPKDKISYLRKHLPKLNYNSLKKINLHTPEISKYSAVIARYLAVRKVVKKKQKSWVQSNKNHCVVEGRDSHLIFPNAFTKFYLKVNLNTAALRRFKELKKKQKKNNS